MLKAKVKPSATLAMLQKVREMKAQGVDVASFAAGEPDFNTPAVIIEAAYAALKAGQTKYAATPGIPGFRQAIAHDYAERLGASWVKPENVIATAGAKQGIYLALAGLLSPQDEVIVPMPFWVSYPDVVEAALGKPVFLKTQEVNGFFPTVRELDAVVTAKTKALIFSSPSNPTGTMISREALKAIVDWCVNKKIMLIYDELYERLILDSTPHVSALSLVNEDDANYIMSINATSKTLSMTGWRVGYLVSSKNNIAALSPLQGQMMTCVPAFVQEGAIAGLKNVHTFLPEFVKQYKERLKVLSEGVSRIPGIKFVKPSGAFYLFIDVRDVLKKKGLQSDEAMVAHVNKKVKSSLQGHLSYLNPMDT